MRRLLQARGAEVIHLGHNRSAHEVVISAIEEDAHAVALSSYQGGHVEYFKYIRDLLNQLGGSHIKIFGGGGGVITPKESKILEQHGITKIYSPEDGQKLGLAGIIGHMLHESDYAITEWGNCEKSPKTKLARALTLLESKVLASSAILAKLGDKKAKSKKVPVLGVTGTGGAGKSSLTDELIARFVFDMPDVKIGALCIDPSKSKTGGALLGDRIRMNTACHDRVFVHSVATRGSGSEVSDITKDALALYTSQDFDLVIVETSGIGQADSEIKDVSDCSLYVMTAEYGASTQLEKIEMLDYADLIAINKFERRQSLDAIRDVRTYLRRSRFQGQRGDVTEYPVFGTIASRFEDDGVNGLYQALCNKLNDILGTKRFVHSASRKYSVESTNREALIPGHRINYLSEISGVVRHYHKNVQSQVQTVKQAEAYETVAETLTGSRNLLPELKEKATTLWASVDEQTRNALDGWKDLEQNYGSDEFRFGVRDKEIRVQTKAKSLSQLTLPKVALPRFESKADLTKYLLKENVPGYFPYTGGLFPFRRTTEDPKRQFAGEGGPLRTNKRFHYLCKDDSAKRLSTAFDSVTLYGSEPDERPDIYGKVGEAGVSIATLDDMKDLYSGFDLCDPSTSVSMTINGPAPIILAMFLNTSIDQQVDAFSTKNGRIPNPAEHEEIVKRTLQVVRGTVQADILKEDQAQNTCIFSIEFALKLMGDIQEFFIQKQVRNYYSVSISGYHIAEAGANPITQLALTLANGFTYVEYYLARGMKIDDFAPNLSFFFSNGLDPEYSVIGRVARRIWAIAMRDIYRGSDRSQKLKYHIQTSGRSLHAQEIAFNDIRTTLQALVALYDNCNSLHTNAYDEAITTPTEESVRRAMAIQMIVNKEFGPNKCENINQGSFFMEELTDLVEEAVLKEFDRLAARGGVLGAMESQYQRSKIQEESLYYESLKDSGELPLIGVNTYLSPNPSEENRDQVALIRSSYEEKDDQLSRLRKFQTRNKGQREAALDKLCDAVMQQKNVFAELMNTVRFASLGEITEALYRVGGKYRRSM